MIGFRLGMITKNKVRLLSHLPHERSKRYVAPPAVVLHLKSPCAPPSTISIFPEQRPSTRYQSPQGLSHFWSICIRHSTDFTRRVNFYALGFLLDGLKRFLFIDKINTLEPNFPVTCNSNPVCFLSLDVILFSF